MTPIKTLTILCLLAFSQSPALALETHDVTLFKGEARVLNEPGIRRMAVGDGEILQASLLDGRQVLVLAEEEGQSSLHLWRRDGTEASYSFTVVPADAGRMLGEVRAMVGDAKNITARIVGDKIVLEGGDVTGEQARRLEEVGKRYPQIVNLISMVGLERMVAIDVSILEFRKTALRDLGIRWNTREINGPNYGIIGDIHRSDALGPGRAGNGVLPGVPTGDLVSPFASYFGLTSTITSIINAAVNNGDASFLAEPRLTCKSGSSAKFLAGGEVPIPLANGFGNVTVQFKPYGVKLEVAPIVSDSGVVTTSVLTELSAVDPQLSVGTIPAFITRRTETNVNLRAGQSLVISGLFDGSSTKSLEKVPGIGDIPVIGELFRSRQYRKNKTELVIFLTPRIIVAGEAPAMAEFEQANSDRAKTREDFDRTKQKKSKAKR
jgi:pilus assembly protein CpaC